MNKNTVYIEKEFIDDNILNTNCNITEKFQRIYNINHDINWLVKTYKDTPHAKREFENLYILKDIKRVPKILCANFDQNVNYIILSKFAGMDFFDYVKKYGSISENELRIITKTILSTLKDIHKKHIIHQDIKPENIIYDKSTNSVNIIDFEEKYTEEYRSPEHVKHKKLTNKTDIWSVGVTIYFLASGKLPFKNKKEILEKTIKYPNTFSKYFIDFLQCLLERDLYLRYDAGKALLHPWVQNYNYI